MRAVIALLLLATACSARGQITAPDVIGVHIGSHHVNKAPAHIGSWNDRNPGLYAYWNNGLTVGSFYNSERRQSFYIGHTEFGQPIGRVIPSITLGVITGYERSPAPLLTAGASVPVTDSTRMRVSWLPKAGRHGSHALHLSFEWRL